MVRDVGELYVYQNITIHSTAPFFPFFSFSPSQYAVYMEPSTERAVKRAFACSMAQSQAQLSVRKQPPNLGSMCHTMSSWAADWLCYYTTP